MTSPTLDDTRDIGIEALASLARTGVNKALQPVLGRTAIDYIYGSPLPLSLLRQTGLPAMTIYRLEDRDRNKGDWVFEDVTTYRFDYMAPATPLVRLDKRWPLLRLVWTTLLATLRQGSHPDVNSGAPMIPQHPVGLCRYVLGSARARYSALPGAEPYPYFQGQMDFESNYPWPLAFDATTLDSFDRLWTDWDIKIDYHEPWEASNISEPNG
jgi:hypothetical protein